MSDADHLMVTFRIKPTMRAALPDGTVVPAKTLDDLLHSVEASMADTYPGRPFALKLVGTWHLLTPDPLGGPLDDGFDD